MTQEFRCKDCGETKAADQFYRSWRTKCKPCVKAEAARNRDNKNAYLREWRQRNPTAHREWYAKNRQKKADYWKDWYSANKERRSKSYAEWARRSKGIVNALIAKRMAAKTLATVAWANHDAIKSVYAEAARLTDVTGTRHEVDHIYPLQSDWVCGLHCEANLQILTKAQNIRKSNRPMAA